MSVHEYDNNLRSDNEFIQGNLSFLVEGNQCRLLDGRRTTGIIEKYFEDSCMFRWRITKYEDKGKFWDLPAENIVNFQFEKDSSQLGQTQIEDIRQRIKKYQEPLNMVAKKSDKENTLKEIECVKINIMKWLKENSLFFEKGSKIDLSDCEGPEDLATDLKNYLKVNNLYTEERKTADNIVLNPNSGEWIKGMKIVLAEMGLVSFSGKVPRTNDIFENLGSKENRRKYIIHRLAFIKAYFTLLGIDEVVLYRGMSNESNFKEVKRSLLHCTFSLDVAKAFSDFDRDSKYKISYMVKLTLPVEKLFMTYLETEAFNRQYKEAEALILYDKQITL